MQGRTVELWSQQRGHDGHTRKRNEVAAPADQFLGGTVP
jgi:hypothetical protein